MNGQENVNSLDISVKENYILCSSDWFNPAYLKINVNAQYYMSHGS